MEETIGDLFLETYQSQKFCTKGQNSVRSNSNSQNGGRNSDENFLQTEILDLTRRIWRPDSARRTTSQSEKITLLTLAMAPRSFLLALIPIVGVGLREHAHTLHRQA